MNHWLFMFRPDTYKKVVEHGTIGVHHAKQKRFAALHGGDRLITYVSRDKLIDGYGTLVGEPYAEETHIFAPDQLYPYRFRVQFEKTGLARPVGDVLWGLSPFQGEMKTTPTNLMLCKGGFIEITQDDYDWLVGWMGGSKALK
ncbi:MAG: EVE domain-containing protein [Bradymonadales bacterium]|nr:EVE domain-containing protein [Bradymonadales bacterium]